MIFHWLFHIRNQYFLSTCGACLEVVFDCKRRALHIGLLRAKLILVPFGMPEGV